MSFIGVEQTPDINKILERARLFLNEGKSVQIERRQFYGELSKEHPYRFEYELYVDMSEE